MKILLDGIKQEDREKVRKNIENMVEVIFKNCQCGVTEINIPRDFDYTVNKIYAERYPGELYFKENEKRFLRGKIFNYKNDTRIILNNILEYDEIISTLYHELVHAHYYTNIEKCRYLDFFSDNIIDSRCFYFVDEYNAYKKTFLRYPKLMKEYIMCLNKWPELSKTFCKDEDLKFQLQILNKHEIYDLDKYMYKIVREITIGMAIIDAKYEMGEKDLLEEYLEKYKENKIICYLFEFINIIKDGVPNKEEYDNLKKCFSEIESLYKERYFYY